MSSTKVLCEIFHNCWIGTAQTEVHCTFVSSLVKFRSFDLYLIVIVFLILFSVTFVVKGRCRLLCRQGFGVAESQLSLRDRSCHPLENSTHYVWTIDLRQCGTELHRRHAVIRYDNSVSSHTYRRFSSSPRQVRKLVTHTYTHTPV